MNHHRDTLIQLMRKKSGEKERPMLLQQVTTVLQNLRQEMGKLAPQLKREKVAARRKDIEEAAQNVRTRIISKEATLQVERAEKALYRNSRVPSLEAIMEPSLAIDRDAGVLSEIQDAFKFFHSIARVDSTLTKLEQDISDYLTEILLLFQEEIVELKMLIRMCQASITTTEKDKDVKMLNALNHIRKTFGTEEDDGEIEVSKPDCTPTNRTWKLISNTLLENPVLIA